MVTKTLIQTEVEKVDESYLEELYELILDFIQSKRVPKQPSLMSRLKNIKIDAPEDFSLNHVTKA